VTLPREEKTWDLTLLFAGIPVMVIGFIVGYGHGSTATMVGTSLLGVMIVLIVCRDMWLPVHKLETQQLAVVDRGNPNRIGVLEVVRGTFKPGDTLKISEVRISRSGLHREWVEVYILQGHRVAAAGTLAVRNGTFQLDQILTVESVETIKTNADVS